MAQPSFAARSFITGRLLDVSTGFNHWIQVCAEEYGIAPFTLSQQPPVNLFLGNLDPVIIEQSGFAALYPLANVYSQRISNAPPLATPAEFAGLVVSVVDFYTGFEASDPPADPETLGDMIEDAMLETFNRPDYAGLTPSGLTYNNEMELQRGGLEFKGQNWRQLLRFTILHRYYSMGR